MDKNKFIEFMINSSVLKFGDFITKSGRNTPYFINTGNYKTGEQLYTLGCFYAELINNVCGDNYCALFGPAYKGIPLVAAVSMALYQEFSIVKPYLFNRKETKKHGDSGNLVGYIPCDNDNIVIVEDVITAGTTLREIFPILQQIAKINITKMFISVDRCERGVISDKTAVMEIKQEFNIDVHSVVTINDIYQYLQKQNADNSLLSTMKEYIKNYCV